MSKVENKIAGGDFSIKVSKVENKIAGCLLDSWGVLAMMHIIDRYQEQGKAAGMQSKNEYIIIIIC